jgi:hypothetical protein
MVDAGTSPNLRQSEVHLQRSTALPVMRLRIQIYKKRVQEEVLRDIGETTEVELMLVAPLASLVCSVASMEVLEQDRDQD